MKTMAMSFGLLAVLVGMPVAVPAEDNKAAIQKKLESEYKITKVNDDKSDIVTAGSVIVLHKDKVLMVAASSSVNPCMNTYKDGKIAPAKACVAGEKIKHIPFGSHIPGASMAPATRYYVSDEKFWLTKIDVRDNGVVFDFFTDAVNDVRFKSSLMIPFPAGLPSAGDAIKLIHEVITVAPADDADKKDDQQPAPQSDKPAPPEKTEAAPPPVEAPAPVEAPPPPPAEVSLGQTPDEVVAALGQPQRKAKVGIKEIYFYKDLKVTFVNGKVKDVQ